MAKTKKAAEKTPKAAEKKPEEKPVKELFPPKKILPEAEWPEKVKRLMEKAIAVQKAKDLLQSAEADLLVEAGYDIALARLVQVRFVMPDALNVDSPEETSWIKTWKKEV